MSTAKTITFIGAGNMSRSLIAGLIQDNTDLVIRAADPDVQQRQSVQQNWPRVTTFENNEDALDQCDIIVLAVKPQIMQKVCETLAPALAKSRTAANEDQAPLIISIAAGINTDSLQSWLGGTTEPTRQLPLVRCMPNTPALVQSGMTGLYANPHTTADQKAHAESILRAVGATLWFDDESSLDTVTAVSGSGPAYFFLVMEVMQKAAQKLGLGPKAARLLVLQTAFGAAKLALESDDEAAVLRQKVTSKGGTTEAAINTLISGGIDTLFESALTAARDRSEALSRSD